MLPKSLVAQICHDEAKALLLHLLPPFLLTIALMPFTLWEPPPLTMAIPVECIKGTVFYVEKHMRSSFGGILDSWMNEFLKNATDMFANLSNMV